MRSFEGQHSDNVAIKRTREQKQRQLVQLKEQLATLKAHPGRVIAFFQPHGYGPLRQMGAELAEVLATRLDPDDVTILCDPVYFGGTVDRSQGSERIVHLIGTHGGHAEYVPAREACADRIVEIARPGDRVVIMGARDDTLSQFARGILGRLG